MPITNTGRGFSGFWWDMVYNIYPIYNGNIFKLRCYAIYIETDTESAEYRLKVIGIISENRIVTL